MKYLFVVGCPRSGTTWAAWLMAQHPATVSALHTGFFEGLHKNLAGLSRPTSFGNRIVGASGAKASDDGGQATLLDVVSLEELHAATRPLATTLLDGVARANPEAEWVIEKTPENLLFSDLVRSVLPEAHFLHIVRDPRAVFSSMKAAAKQWAYPGDLSTHPVAFCRSYWNPCIDAHLRLLEHHPHYLTVRYEDLLRDGVNELAKIYDWLGLEADRVLCENAVEASSIDSMRSKLKAPKGFFRAGRADTWRADLSGYELKVIEYLSGERMQPFGYACSSPEPRREPLRMKMSDSLAAFGRKLIRGPLARPIDSLFGQARRSSETIRRMADGD